MNDRILYTLTGAGIGAFTGLVGGANFGRTVVRTVTFGAVFYFILWPAFLQ